MGVYYHYVNLSKKERFSIDSLGGAIKRNGLGRTLASRAFHLMLETVDGRWAGDSIAIMGDGLVADWQRIAEEFVDIEANAIGTLLSADGFSQIREKAAEETALLMQLCHMVVTRQTPGLETELNQLCGGSCQKRYAELCKEHPWFVPKNVVK